MSVIKTLTLFKIAITILAKIENSWLKSNHLRNVCVDIAENIIYEEIANKILYHSNLTEKIHSAFAFQKI